MLGVVQPHADLNGVALPDPLENVLHPSALLKVSQTLTFFQLTNENHLGIFVFP